MSKTPEKNTKPAAKTPSRPAPGKGRPQPAKTPKPSGSSIYVDTNEED